MQHCSIVDLKSQVVGGVDPLASRLVQMRTSCTSSIRVNLRAFAVRSFFSG